jgi:hypothetical protein
MNYRSNLKDFLAQYFPTFIGAFFLAALSIASALSLVESTYLGGYSGLARAMLVVTIILSLTLTFGHFMMIRGRRWAVWIIVTFYLISLMAVLPTYSYRPHILSYTTGILFPLLGLLMLNSKRHREMREELVKVRAQRIKARNKSRKRS